MSVGPKDRDDGGGPESERGLGRLPELGTSGGRADQKALPTAPWTAQSLPTVPPSPPQWWKGNSGPDDRGNWGPTVTEGERIRYGYTPNFDRAFIINPGPRHDGATKATESFWQAQMPTLGS